MNDKSIPVRKILKQLVGNYLSSSHSLKGEKLVAWCTAISPGEFLHTMDIIPVYPENYGVVVGAQKMGIELSEPAEEQGYANDICSYARVSFGSILSGKSAGQGLPRPDLLLCCNNTCATVTKWWENLSRYFKVPLLFVDIPFNQRVEVPRATVEYIAAQFKDLIPQLEQVTARKFDWDRFREVASNAYKSTRLWRKVIELNAHRPAPYTIFDAFNYMAPVVMMRGTQEALDFYTVLKESIEADIAAGVAAVPEERYRLLFDGIPMWYELKYHSELFRKYGMALIFSTYAYFWGLDYEPGNLESMAEAFSKPAINSCIYSKFSKEQELIKDYGLDGVIRHSNRSCKPLAFSVYDLQKLMVDKFKLPVLIVDGDQTDQRNYSKAQFEMRLEAFREVLEEKYSR